MKKENRPIGVFDSGVGGLTVLDALRKALPVENFIYLGDTARLPYGTKSPETVARYGLQVAARLRSEGIKLLVVACNTASALALPALRAAWPDLPVMGVIEPGAAAAVAASRSGRIAVMATEGTVRSKAYGDAIRKLRPDADVQGLACNLLVGVAEEGWSEGPEAEIIVARYLGKLAPDSFDTLVLGCTHFPLLKQTIRKFLPPSIEIVDSAVTTAKVVASFLAANGLQNAGEASGSTRLLVTDAPDRFRALAARFLPADADFAAVETIDLSQGAGLRPRREAEEVGRILSDLMADDDSGARSVRDGNAAIG
jgi:glutamate racemase